MGAVAMSGLWDRTKHIKSRGCGDGGRQRVIMARDGGRVRNYVSRLDA